MIEQYDPKDDPFFQINGYALVPRAVYLAGPFFNAEQVAEIKQVEEMLKNLGLTFFSPRLVCRYHRGDGPQVAARAFYLNRRHVRHCQFVLACLSWPDAGTAWELGFADAILRPRIGWSSNAKAMMNLMVRNTVDRLLPLHLLPGSLSQVKLDLERSFSPARAVDNLPAGAQWLEGEQE